MKFLNCTIVFSDVIDRCRVLSSYEGRDAFDANGESLYQKLKITIQDEPLIKEYTNIATHDIEPKFGKLLVESEYEADKVVFTLEYDDSRWSRDRSFCHAVFEAVCLSVMQQWFSFNGETTKSERFANMSDEMAAACTSVLFSKKKPKL